jgi:hypothetical protein
MSAEADDAAEREAYACGYMAGLQDSLEEAERRFRDNSHMAAAIVRELQHEIESGEWPPEGGNTMKRVETAGRSKGTDD